MMKIDNVRLLFTMVSLAAVVVVGGCALATSKPKKAEAVPAKPPTEIVRKEVVLDATTLFAFDSAELTSEGKAALDRLTGEAAGETAGRITVTGHTDRIGPEEYNMNLSQRRADSVANYMTNKGVPAGSISTSGKGESEPVVECEDQRWRALVECLAPNRRVVVQYPVTVEEEVPTED